jgi:hypothetical protein
MATVPAGAFLSPGRAATHQIWCKPQLGGDSRASLHGAVAFFHMLFHSFCEHLGDAAGYLT